jgi:hypothetical protein
VAPREGYRFRVFDDSVLKGTSDANEEETTERWGNSHNVKLHEVYG